MRESTDIGEKLMARRRVFIVYIDGYNLYKAIDHPSTLKLGWRNYKLLAESWLNCRSTSVPSRTERTLSW